MARRRGSRGGSPGRSSPLILHHRAWRAPGRRSDPCGAYPGEVCRGPLPRRRAATAAASTGMLAALSPHEPDRGRRRRRAGDNSGSSHLYLDRNCICSLRAPVFVCAGRSTGAVGNRLPHRTQLASLSTQLSQSRAKAWLDRTRPGRSSCSLARPSKARPAPAHMSQAAAAQFHLVSLMLGSVRHSLAIGS